MVTRISLVKLRPELERSRALELWTGSHADVVRAIPTVEHYAIALAEGDRDPEQFDAVATLRFADRRQLDAALGDERTQRDLMRTREPFIERAEAFVVEEHVIIDRRARA